MIMAKVIVNPGICGFVSSVEAHSEDGQIVSIQLKSGCSGIKDMESDLQSLDSFSEVLGKYGASKVFQSAAAHCPHPACPIPIAILKAIEVECNLALPKAVGMEIEKDK
jgi:hypothetical protein